MKNLDKIFIAAHIKSNYLEGTAVSKNEKIFDSEVEILRKWSKMLKRKADKNEKYNFVLKHNFLSEKHFLLYEKCREEQINIEQKLNETDKRMSELDLSSIKIDLKDAKERTKNIKNIYSYRLFMNKIKKQDYTPYGVNALLF